jgi:ribosomal RNA-processing protein 8
MLFDTPTLSITAAAATPTKFTGAAASKKRARSSDAVSTSKASVEMNLDKLMKRMRKTEKDSGWGGSLGAGGKSGVEAEEAAARKKSKKSKTGGGGGGGGREDRPAKAEVQKEVKGEVKPNRFQPAKKDKRVSNLAKREKKAAAATWSPASSANATYVPSFASTVPESTSAVVDAPRFTAPNHHDAESDEATTSGPQTELQKSLRAKLAGGRFRMLNETLYTTTGAEARNVMTDPGAFDDVRPSLSLPHRPC